MAIKPEDLKKLSKSTELIIKLIEDDSSTGTTVKMLHLVKEVTAVGSIPIRENGEIPRAKSNVVYVAAENIDEFMKNANYDEKEGLIIYNGPMHLDIGKPKTRVNQTTGELTVTAPAKIWLTAVKFSRRGTALQQNSTQQRDAFIAKFFGGGKIVDVGGEASAVAGEVKDEVKNEPEPVVVGEKVGEE